MDTITITFSKAMDTDTLKLAGDLSSGTGEWTSAANDTLTLISISEGSLAIS